jgi:outer membrane protein OmpA-like peptidoglycan-associated protein
LKKLALPSPAYGCRAVLPGKFRFYLLGLFQNFSFEKASLALFLFIYLAAPLLPAQTAAEMDILLETESVSFGQAARFVLDAANLIDPGSAAGAFALARQNGWLPERALKDNPIKTGELAFLIMRTFNMKGSFLYRLFPGPRYAFREFDYRGLIPGRRDPDLKVSGEGLLRILSMTSAYLGRGTAEFPDEGDRPAIPVESLLAAPPSSPRDRRKEIVDYIRGELEQQEIADTSVRIVEDGVAISLDNIQLIPDSAALTQGEKDKLRAIAGILSPYPDRQILVIGYTASAGTGEGRQGISMERARAVADFLVSLGFRRAGEILIRGYGARQPLGGNAMPAGQVLNRRVEIILVDERVP